MSYGAFPRLPVRPVHPFQRFQGQIIFTFSILEAVFITGDRQKDFVVKQDNFSPESSVDSKQNWRSVTAIDGFKAPLI